jgi:NAD(P)-dependent dehydrogenase (short-subunit alcohol dehydrogenase family)
MAGLDGKIALVTGASRGIGTAIAQRLAMDGAAVAVSARTVNPGESRFEGTINETVDLIRREGGTAIALAADLSRPDQRQRLLEETERELGPIDILVNNAAVTWFEPVAEFKESHYDLMFEVQVKAAFQMSQHVLEGMRARGSGWILNISSRGAIHPEGPPYQGARGGTVYGMCKAALERFTTGLASEVWADGIAVNVLSPTKGVLTPGVIHHKLVPPGTEAERTEGVEVIAEAAHALVSGDPKERTGIIGYSQEIVERFGLTPTPIPA